MFVLDAQTEVQQHVSSWVTLLSRVVWPALATLVPAGITAVFKLAQNHSRSRRSVQLTDRISQLAKSIAELPEPCPGVSVSPRAALTAELNLAVNELSALQTRARYHLRGVSNTATAKLRGALLLFRPQGKHALTVQTLFYLYNAFFLFCVLAVIFGDDKPGDTPFFTYNSASDLLSEIIAFIFIVGIFSIPMLTLHHIAVKIHRKQPLATQPVEPQPVGTHAAAPVPLSQPQTGG
jgi:hypothetical protein